MRKRIQVEKEKLENDIAQKFKNPIPQGPPNCETFFLGQTQVKENQWILAAVVGESGIGKTTSVKAFAHNLRQKDYPVIFTTLDKDIAHLP